ncbi:phosphotransferase family protein [Haloarcula onubensis]|uniref:Phosphotransferase family protein n=1 Tax=Haloarcula onubensis TaxID=2950539 RepID=A0ABU2FL75_9EURY|nr:phosphotransferase family protein [Halomicroarcula sp. S3CR25-11]MDS0281500.1 phosphotransferase family protein [Halomicroarcula sp. S3CR25-11]
MSTPEADIRAVLDESGPDYNGFTFETPGGGHQSDVYMVTLDHGGEEYEVVVKFKPDGDIPFDIEPKLHEYVANRTDVPVPRILVFKQEPGVDVRPYFVTERVHGENLSQEFATLSAEDRRRVMAQAGHILGDLHSEIGFEAFGRLDLHNGRLIVRDWMGNWREYFEQLTRAHLSRLDETPFADVKGRALEKIEPALEFVPEDGVPRLVHDDFRPANLLFEAGADRPITAVLDWQDVLAALPEYNLAQTEFLFIDSSFSDPDVRESLRSEFHEGYTEHRPMDFEDGYADRRPLYQLSTLLWRMAGFEAVFDDDSGLVQARAEAQYRQQFERLLDAVPE